jgi:uncharacterized protein
LNFNKQTERIQIIDIIRGVAVLGIFFINIMDMAFPEDLVLDFHATDPEMGWNYWIGVLKEILFSDKMRGLFSLLFGVSSVLIVEKLVRNFDATYASKIYFRRLAWLLFFGLVHAYILVWWGEVLFKYALLGTLLFPFRRASYWILASVVAFSLLVLTIQPAIEYQAMVELQQSFNYAQNKQNTGQTLTSDDREAINLWQESLDDMHPEFESIEDEILIKTGGYFELFKYNAGKAWEEQTTIFFTEDIWDIILYMFLGIILFRMNFFEEHKKYTLHLIITLFGIGTGLAVHTWLNLGFYENHLDPVKSSYYLIFFDLGRLPFVLGYTSLIILVFRMKLFHKVGKWIASVGKMALSNYLIHSIIGAFVFYGFGLALFNQLSHLDITMIVISVWVFQIVFSVLWMRSYQYGPFEWIWRSLTYWKVQPLRRI